MEEMKSKVYILTDEKNRVTRLDGGYSISNVDTSTWTLIDEGVGDKYNLCQSHYLDKPLMTYDGFCQYKYDGENVVERTDAEINNDRNNVPPTLPTQEERIEAQVLYTALMTDTLLEED